DVRAAATAAGARVIGVVARADQLPLRSRVFDAAASEGTLSRLADDEAAVREIARVLRPGGRALFAEPNRGDAILARAKINDRARGVKRSGRAYFHSNTQVRDYTRRELEQLVSPVLRIRARRAVGWERGWKSRIASALIRVAPLERFSHAFVLETEPR
ncbi:MAG: hypothetical protein JWL83_1044, partial [Actinomycetia bacterium]|nr:hypothetical protein [Actinomycetes bacterium]